MEAKDYTPIRHARPPTDKELARYDIVFRLLPRTFEPLPDMTRFDLDGREVPLQCTVEQLVAAAADSGEVSARNLVYAANRLCAAIGKLPGHQTSSLKARFDYWPEMVRTGKRGRSINSGGLWMQYALNAIWTLREAHLVTLRLLQRISDFWSIGTGFAVPFPESRKKLNGSEFPLDDGRVIRVPAWRMLACSLALYPDDGRDLDFAWKAAEQAIREFWEKDNAARKAAFAKVRGAVAAGGTTTPGRLRDAALKEIKRAFIRLMKRQIEDTVRAIGPNGMP